METVIEINEIVEGMPIVEAAIDKIRHDLNIREEVFGNVLIAVTEAVNNAYYHGNKGDNNKTVKISFIKPGQYRLAVVVCDQGEGFDPNNLEDPTEPENIEKEGGRGVFLMKNLCDKLSFSEGGKVVELNFNI